MSWQATTHVINHSRMKGGALLTLIVLANHASGDEAIAWPSQETLARETRMSERQIRRILDTLVASGEIAELGRFGHYIRRFKIIGVNPGHNVRPGTVDKSGEPRTFSTGTPDIFDRNPGHSYVRQTVNERSESSPLVPPKGGATRSIDQGRRGGLRAIGDVLREAQGG